MRTVATAARTREHHLGHCPACGTRGGEQVADANGLRLDRCPDCGLVYSDPQPRAAVLARYLEDYDIAAHFQPLSARKKVLFDRHLNSLVAPEEGADRLCDVGCADGQFLDLARDRGWQCTGIELNPPAAARARSRGFDIVEGDFTRIEDLSWGAFDVVTCWDCLEHSPEPRAFAERLVRLTKPGGRLLVTTLNLGCLAFRVFGTRWSMVHPDHFTYWSSQSLERLFTQCGCSVDKCESFGLGRDFVRWLDKLQPLRVQGLARRAGAESGGDRGEQPGRAGWDVNRGVLGAERMVNRVLAATDSGVDITCTMRRDRAAGSPLQR